MSINNFAKKAVTSKTPSPASLVTGVTDCVTAITDYLKVKESEQSKRVEIQARRDIAITAIQSQKEVLLSFIEKTYAERSFVIQHSLDMLDKAIERGDVNVVNSLLATIVNVIQINPLEQIKKVSDALSNQDSILRLE